MLSIANARVTFVSVECFFEHLAAPPSDGDYTLWDEASYIFEFNQLRGGQPIGNYDFAWYPSQKSAFWCHYLGSKALDGVPAKAAWEAMVPFRLMASPVTVAPTDLGERVIVDAYGYSYGIGVAVTIHTQQRASASLDDWQARLRDLRFQPVHRIDSNDGRGVRSVILEDMLGELLEGYRRAYYEQARTPIRSYEPISIVNLVQASGGNPAKVVDESLQRRLHAVTAWPADWENAILPPLGSYPAFLPIRTRNQVAGDALYAAARGRTIWRPALFAPQDPADGPRKRHTLSCLGHNLVASSVQAEYLRLFALGYASSAIALKRVDRPIARKAGSLLASLHNGTGTYRSSSVRAALEDASSLKEVNALIKLAGEPEIVPSAPSD
jgi:hypothetical protein